MKLDMKTRRAVTKQVAGRYRRASKKKKGKILDEFTATTDYNRSYAATLLRKGPVPRKKKGGKGKAPRMRDGRGRKPTYGPEVLPPLRKTWGVLNFPCGRRLVAAMPEMVRVLEKFKELELSDEVREKLLSMSSSTADRLLRGDRKKLELKSRSRTRPGSLLKHQIPIRTFADWDDARPGFLEMDLVGHDGGNTSGDYCQSLNATDISTGWTEPRGIKNKAQVWTFEAIEDMREALPFPLLGLDSDNGSEFINAHLYRYCEKEEITFTRSREYRKNDNCYVEQKNYTAVRTYVGYMRYDTDEELGILNELYSLLRLYLNFFQPQMKLIEKTRIGSKVKKKYDHPKTPRNVSTILRHLPSVFSVAPPRFPPLVPAC
ncbi:MAG: ISNCY family transposase [Actinobacteria bacterium]|nr:ISNCY family transposase [Actinomycetota bacterium]